MLMKVLWEHLFALLNVLAPFERAQPFYPQFSRLPSLGLRLRTNTETLLLVGTDRSVLWLFLCSIFLKALKAMGPENRSSEAIHFKMCLK